MQALPAGPRPTPRNPRPPRAPVAMPASPLVRLLARWRPGHPPAAAPAPLAERLAPWLGLTDAIALAAALAPTAATPAHPATAAGEPAAAAARLRAQLAAGLADAAAPATPAPRGGPPWRAARPEDPADFTPHRRRYHARQQAMETAIAPLRAQLRGVLAARSPALARLAAVDAALEQALAERERGLLAGLPVLLEQRFEQLRHAAVTAPAPTRQPAVAAAWASPRHPDAGAAPPMRSEHVVSAAAPTRPAPAAGTPGWLATFRHDMHQLLQAELDHRWQPIAGLLAALPPSTTP